MRLLACALTATLMAAPPVFAHHSFAMFDQTKEITLSGTVTEWQWTNPHSWLELDVPSRDGRTAVHWSLESGSPHTLTRLGWRPKMVKPGDKVVVTLHPMKDGSHGGAMQSIIFADGHKMAGGGG